MSSPPVVFISAGEVSGDHHAAAVARQLRDRVPGIRMRGLGGPEMAEAGVTLLAGLEDLAVMGIGEVVRRLAFFRDLRRRVYADLSESSVDLLIPVDYPGFNLPLAGRAHSLEIPVLYYIAPQVWAWREGRAARLAEVCDRVLTVLPFEDQLLRRYGADSRFVGHPLLDTDDRGADHPRADEAGEASDDGPVIGLFPGSREQEIERILPLLAEAAKLISQERPELRFQIARAPHIARDRYEAAGAGIPLGTPEDTIRRAYAALTKSGTVTLQLALAGVPMVVAYRTGRVTYAVAKRLVRVPSIALVNLVAEGPVVPEFIQDEATPRALATALAPLLDEGPERKQMISGLGGVRSRLGGAGCSERVATNAIELLQGR